MDWLFGSKQASQAQVPDTALRIQTAVQGKPRPVGCGQARLAGNLIWYGDFQSQSQSVGGKGAVFGGGKGGGQTFTYTVAVLFGICEGPIVSIIQAWDQQNKKSLSSLGASVLLGGYAQSPWSYLTSNHPTQADNNRGLALVGLGPAQLGSSSALPNWSWEVLFAINNGIAGFPDADPRDWVTNLLTNQYWGQRFPVASLDTMTSFSNWCRATGMVMSDALVSQQALNSYLAQIAEATASEFVWNGGLLSIVPYGDVTYTNNGVTYTPPSAPVVTVGDDDLIKQPQGRVVVSRARLADFDNWVQIEYQDRHNDYNKVLVEAKDPAQIAMLGAELNNAGRRSYSFFSLNKAALMSAHLLLGRQLVHNTYKFILDSRYLFLDPMDIIAVNDKETGLVNQWVRIKQIQEGADGNFTITAEEYLQGTATPYDYQSQLICCTDQGLTSLIADPGPTSFAYWDATLCGVPTGPALILGAGGLGTANTPRPGTKGMIVDWYYPKFFHDNPTLSGSQILFESLPNDGINASFVLEAVFSGSGANVTIGAVVQAKVANGGSNVTLTALADAGAQASIPTNGFGVIVTWDFTTTTWILRVRINAGTALITSAVESDVIDPNHPLFQSVASVNGVLGTYQIGSGDAQSQMFYSQLWIGIDGDVDGVDLTIPDSVWTKFFLDVGANASTPIKLNSDGSKPFGCPPTFYFGSNAGTGGANVGNSTGCLAGNVLPTKKGTFASIGAGSIPAAGSFQAIGYSFGASTDALGPMPFGGLRNIWGSTDVWISTDGGVTFQKNPASIPGPSPIGVTTAVYPAGGDPDTVNTLAVDLTETQGVLAAYAQSDADAGRSRCVVGQEIIDYTAAALTGTYKYNLGTYVRRGQLGSAPTSHPAGSQFGQLGANAITILYPTSLIGKTIQVKFTARNKTGGGGQSLANVPANSILLVGPGSPANPSSLTIVQVVAASGSINANWPQVTSCGVTGYDFAYDQGGGDVTILSNANQQSASVNSLPPGTYNFKVRAVNSAGLKSGWTTVTIVVTAPSSLTMPIGRGLLGDLPPRRSASLVPFVNGPTAQ